MDGFRDRLGGRYDRSGMRGSGYERMPSDDRYDSDRYERAPRRNAPEGVSPEAISEVVNEAIAKSNREQLDVIADLFDEAKADRMESERAIIDAFSHGLSEASRPEPAKPAPEPAQVAPIVVDEQNSETLARIERIAGNNAEALNDSNEALQRNVDSLRSNAELLNEIKNILGSALSSSQETKDSLIQKINELGARSGGDLTVDFSEEKNEIIGAVGDNRAILNMIRQDVLNGFANSKAEEETEEKIAPLSADDAEKYYKELEDHVHKECVKCYRNVQQALTEQNAEANSGLGKSVSGMRIMVLLALIFGAIGAITGILNFLVYNGLIMLPF